MTKDNVGRRIKNIDGMVYAPTNEQGVVFLFGRLATILGYDIELVRTGFPDCIARKKGKTYKIEFEYRASNYERQEHPPRGADVVVCWDNDWETRARKYKHLKIIPLRNYVDAKPRIFAVAANEDKWRNIDKLDTINWDVPRNAQVGDLVIIYRRSPASMIKDVWEIVGPFFEDQDYGLETKLRIIGRLKKPITYSELKKDPTTQNLGVVRKRFQGKTDITEDWPHLFRKIVHLNPRLKTKIPREYHVY